MTHNNKTEMPDAIWAYKHGGYLKVSRLKRDWRTKYTRTPTDLAEIIEELEGMMVGVCPYYHENYIEDKAINKTINAAIELIKRRMG